MTRQDVFTAAYFVVLFTLASCATAPQSNPPRTATEQLLISTAAEHAAAHLALDIPENSAVFLENGNFEGTDSKYAIGAIRTNLLQKGIKLIDDKKKADVIIETRSGALSIDRSSFLVGIPQFNIPVPFSTTPVSFPEIALYSNEEQKGVAKFAITSYDAKKGSFISAQEPQYGFSHRIKKTVLIFISWMHSNALPENIDPDDDNSGDQAKEEKPHAEIPLPP